MEENKSILHELYVFSEWKPEPEYIQKSDNILPENISAFWRWLKYFGPKKSLIDSVAACKERQQKWHIALGDEGKVIAILTDNILEIRTKRSEYATIAARTTVSRDGYPQWRKLVWSPDCSFLAMAYGNGVVSFFDLTASNLFNIPTDCSRPGGLECTDNTHAVADIIFMPLRVKDNKWNWEVLVVTFDGRLRGYLVSATDGCKLHHSFRFAGGVGALTYCAPHATLYVCGLPRPGVKDPSSPLSAGITAWRILNDDPFYKLSVVSDQLETQLANERFQLYVPFVSAKNLPFIVHMVISPDNSKLVCVHCTGEVTVWRLPLLRLLQRWPLAAQPAHDLRNPLVADDRKDAMAYHASDVHWWSAEEIIVSRFNGAVSVCNIDNMVNILGKKPEFFQGAPRVTCAHVGTFMVLECESSVLPAKKMRSDESMEVVQVAADTEDTMLDMTKEMVKSILFAITDMETFQPRPRKITVVSRVYRLLGVRSTTPEELFSRKIESGNYVDALSLAETFNLDSDLVYQQQWRKNPVSTDAIQKYLSKVSKKIWAVHQCVDRLPETLPAAKELLQFGLALTNSEILKEINKERDDKVTETEDIVLVDLNAYTSELLRCRHVMLFYRDRVTLYEAILRCEKSTYVKDEYHRIRSNSLVHSSIEIAKEGRIEALTCLWPHIKTVAMQLAVLESLPETINPLDYQHLLPIKEALMWFEKKSPVKVIPSEYDNDWCRKEIFRSIWSSNWSEDSTPDSDNGIPADDDISKWYDKRAREVEANSGLVSHALTLATLATVGGGVGGLDDLMFNLLTLDTLIYDLNVEGVTLDQLEKLNPLETCKLLMKMSTPATFVSDLKQYVIPFLKRVENLTKRTDACLNGLIEYLESISVKDLSPILLVLQSPNEFELDVRTHLDLAERCLFAYTETEQLDKACDLLDTILKESDGSISPCELVRRVKELERLVAASSLINWRGVGVAPRELRDLHRDHERARKLLMRVARADPAGNREDKCTQQEWEKLLKDLLELQSTLFDCVSKEEIYEIYASSLLTSGDASSIQLAPSVLTCSAGGAGGAGAGAGGWRLAGAARAARLVLACAREYFNSASALRDPALNLAKCALLLIQFEDAEIQKELDLIASLEILSAFNLDILPIQVRLCEDRLTLIEKCLDCDPNAFMASHKLLKLAKLLRVAGDDEHARESQVLQLVASHAISAGAGGCAAAASAARRLAELRAPAAGLLATVARRAHAHADRAARRDLYAAAATYCEPGMIEDILKDRLSLELEGLQVLGAAVREHQHLNERWTSVDDEFADAITTPIIEKKDLVAPEQPEKKIPLFNYIMDSFQNKVSVSDAKPEASDTVDHAVYCQEFYRSLYPAHKTSESGYSYTRFSLNPPGQECEVLQWCYEQSCLEGGLAQSVEGEVVQRCGEELLTTDTALSVACLLRAARLGTLSARGHSRAAGSAALYAAALAGAAPALRDHAYLAEPEQLVRLTLESENTASEQVETIWRCLLKLSGCSEVEQIRALGITANSLLFGADADYRREIIFRLAKSPTPEHLELACSLAKKYDLDELEVWLQHAEADPSLAHLAAAGVPASDADTHARIREALWPQVSGSEHNALINLFSILRGVDERPALWGLTAADHVKLLKKVKAASNELDYKLLLSQPSTEEFSAHILAIIKPENVGMVTKLLRTLPPAFKLPVPVNAVYTMWLTKYFFSEPQTGASNKKWMQRYRQCASYFNKLAKRELLRFLADTCFSEQALRRVPSGTRSLMLMQAVDYCQQEQENDFKFTKDEMSWTQVGQELTRWARFLENFHSTTIQGIIDNSPVPRDEIWPSVEQSHGSLEAVLPGLGRLVLRELRSGALATLLQCLHVPAAAPDVLRHVAETCAPEQVPTLVTRVTQYHKEGVKLPEDLLERVMQKATESGLPPHKQIGLLALSQRGQPRDSGDMRKLAQYTADLFRTEWAGTACGAELADEKLLTEEGRREVFKQFLEFANSWQRKKALVDILNCWPAIRDSESRSIHCEYLAALLADPDPKEGLALIKLMMRRPLLTEEELKWLIGKATGESVLNIIWIVLISKCESAKDDVVAVAIEYRDFIIKQEIDDEFIRELLDCGMFLRLVPTPLYASIINYIVTRETSVGEPADNVYNVKWAIAELVIANHLTEAGQLQLLTMGVPASLRGFTQTVLYCKNMFKK